MADLHYVAVCDRCAEGDCCHEPNDEPGDVERAERTFESEGWQLWPHVLCPDCNPLKESPCPST